MTETIIVALITGGLTLMGVLIANSKQQAVMETKLEEQMRLSLLIRKSLMYNIKQCFTKDK